MSLVETVIEGTIQLDGTLVLDQKPGLPAGRVTVVLRQDIALMLPKDDPFWQRMQSIWAIPATTFGDGGETTLEEVRKMREEWDEHQEAIEKIQDECRLSRKSAEEPNS